MYNKKTNNAQKQNNVKNEKQNRTYNTHKKRQDIKGKLLPNFHKYSNCNMFF